LENAVERAMVFCKSGILNLEFFNLEGEASAEKVQEKGKGKKK
jgi:hypothetical protein